MNTSRPGDLEFDQLHFKIYFPMLQLANWTRRLNSDSLEKLYGLLRATTAIRGSLASTLEHLEPYGNVKDFLTWPHPWMKLCRYITRRKRITCGFECWQSFYEECELHMESSPSFSWPLPPTGRISG